MGKISSRESFNRVLNQLWSMIVVAPLVVMFWRGIWDILDIVVYPDIQDEDSQSTKSRKEKSGMVSVMLGVIIRIVLDLAKFHTGEFLQSRPGTLSVIGGNIFTLVYAAAGVSFWRGVWLVMRFDIGEDREIQLSVIILGGLAVLVFSGVASTLIATPLAICQDKHENIFMVSTFFQRTPENKRWFVTDVLFTNIIVRVLIVMSWWSLWSLESNFLIPNLIGIKDKKFAFDSVLIGYFLTIVVAVLDRLLVNFPFSKQYINKPLRQVIIILAFVASMNVWRGVWSMYDNYLFPENNHALNYTFSALLAYIALAVFRLSSTISNDTIVWDPAEGPVVVVDYWSYGLAESNEDEMIPIVE